MEAISVSEKQASAKPGHVGEYATAFVPVGGVVTATLILDGKIVATLGPWTASAKLGKGAAAQLRLRVEDNATLPEEVR